MNSIRIFADQDRGVEQLVARWAHNPKVAGSSPVPATRKASSKELAFVIYTCESKLASASNG